MIERPDTHEEVMIKALLDSGAERVQKEIAYWDKQNSDVFAPNCMLKVWGEIIKNKGL